MVWLLVLRCVNAKFRLTRLVTSVVVNTRLWIIFYYIARMPRAIWFGSGLSLRIPIDDSLSLPQWIKSWDYFFATSKKQARTVWSHISCLCWSIWLSSNDLYFHGKQGSPVDVIFRASKAFEEYLSITSSLKETQPARDNQSWTPPLLGFTKLNIDVSFSVEHKSGCIGFIFQDSHGNSLFAASENISAPSVLLGEALAIRAGLQSAVVHGFLNLVVESDSTELIAYLTCPSSTPPYFAQFVLEDILSLSTICNATFQCISRDANQVTHALVRK
ncbi:hypothetical protein NE237_020835 [Protea cynaroides]|uniref:RNase H type-1 domain-containing protein n=1 Tax=Protea cynaroides TaxID=273540 RepID=A0A9Q0HA50_9MAGN|nr:hypothetical protein NE237_020835 [Protea cynaroides]